MDVCKLFRLKYKQLYTDLQATKLDVEMLAVQLYTLHVRWSVRRERR